MGNEQKTTVAVDVDMNGKAWRTFEAMPIDTTGVEILHHVKAWATTLWDTFDKLQASTDTNSESKRYFAVAKTELETAVMWAVKGISRTSTSTTKTNAA